jgi:hypothetical protein
MKAGRPPFPRDQALPGRAPSGSSASHGESRSGASRKCVPQRSLGTRWKSFVINVSHELDRRRIRTHSFRPQRGARVHGLSDRRSALLQPDNSRGPTGQAVRSTRTGQTPLT